MSVAHTEASVRDRTKDVTRRLGWEALRAGDDLDLCRKVMGRKAGDPLVRIARVHVVGVTWEPLDAITDEDARREGVAGVETAADFIAFYCDAFRVEPSRQVRRIEWRYAFDFDRFTPAPPGEHGEERWWCVDCIPAIGSRDLHDAAHHIGSPVAWPGTGHADCLP